MNKELPDEMLRGQMYYADLDPVIGSEQGGKRPVLVLQNNVGNYHSPTIIIAPITTRVKKLRQPTHIGIPPYFGLSSCESTVCKPKSDVCTATSGTAMITALYTRKSAWVMTGIKGGAEYE